MSRRRRDVVVDPFATTKVDEWLPPHWSDPFADPTVGAGIAFPAPSGDLEADCAAELEAVRSAFGDRKRDEDRRRADATDGDFYMTVVFKNQAEVDAFIASLGLPAGTRYVVGAQLAALVAAQKG